MSFPSSSKNTAKDDEQALMDKFTALEPTRLYSSSASTTNKRASRAQPISRWIGKLPADIHLLILNHLPIPDIPAYARASRATAGLSRDEKVWERRWDDLAITRHALDVTLDDIESKQKPKASAYLPPTIPVDDDFGDFTSAPRTPSVPSLSAAFTSFTLSAPRYTRAHSILNKCLAPLQHPPHAVLSALTPLIGTSLLSQARSLRLLSFFLSPRVQPVRNWDILLAALKAAIDRFDVSLLTAFDTADSRGDELMMRQTAHASWEVWPGTGDWEMGKVWAEKREILYEQGRWNPLANFTEENTLDFTPMDEFMASVIGALEEHGKRAVFVFPPAAGVLIGFAERVANEVVGEYIAPLLTRAREISNALYLTAVAASFRESWRIVDVLTTLSSNFSEKGKDKTEDVVFLMFEPNMDEYLDEEIESVICKEWARSTLALASHGSPTQAQRTRFLTAQNPALMKRTVLASFTDVLLLPVTIVPRTVGAGVVAVGGAVGGAVGAVGTGMVQGIAMLNPQRWVGGTGSVNNTKEYTSFGLGDAEGEASIFEIGADEEGGDDGIDESSMAPSSTRDTASIASTNTAATSFALSTSSTSQTAPTGNLDLLLSLDVALQLIHADRDALKRLETFVSYPGHYGIRVRETIEEAFCEMLGVLCNRHLEKGFGIATERMDSYKPAEHEETASVAPLLQFFELVHIGDTIQSMVQVFFDKELAPYIDKKDFLNVVVREKKRFENTLDDCVAAGLNAGTQVLMNQVEHIILTLTKPREYYPPEDAPLELGPTQGCTEAIRCLDTHCKLLKGSTSKEVLEVFYQEVGIRLLGILQKHIKRQIISLNGGFQVIADLNAYYSFIASLKVPNITADFSHLKMLGHVFVVEDAKDLAQIVRDVTRYGGAYRPEDIYEFIQRRADWKKIEKTVDKTMYSLSFKEDCIVC
ncbi:exocyst complex component Sec10-like protein [Suillus subaureus]|uniref:Exocyst complex component Sec10-like protein n=1 Tax=Suillus subaureus TaxID=48587 RepID=A0A9P7E0C5_9AGAM|nr:exocyst complex component Sec10-like protein [Suillus subaureus]KAG1807438.1 exocyst complex component Sec10-like protein [Suillus subaureus]